MFVVLLPYLAENLFFRKFQQMNIGVSCMSILWAAFFGLAVHHCWIRTGREEWSGSMPALPAKLLRTLAANIPVLKICSMQSIPDLLREQKQFDGSMPKLVSL